MNEKSRDVKGINQHMQVRCHASNVTEEKKKKPSKGLDRIVSRVHTRPEIISISTDTVENLLIHGASSTKKDFLSALEKN